MTSRSLAPGLFLLLLTALPAAAAPAGEPRPRPRHDRPLRRELRERLGEGREEMGETIALFFLHKVRTELQLDDEQALRLLPLIQRAEEARRDSERRRRDSARELERLADDPGAREQAVAEHIQAIDREEERSRIEQNRIRDEILALFTPRQKARFVVFAHRFRRLIEDKLRGMGPNPGGPGAEPRQPGLPGAEGRDPEAPARREP